MFAPQLLILVSGLLCILLGAILWRQIRGGHPKKDAVHMLSLLLHDALVAYSKRVSSSMLQIVVYVSVILVVFSQIFKQPFSWVQVLSFFLGSVTMVVSTAVSFSGMGRLLPRLLQKSNRYLRESVESFLNTSACIGFTMIGITMVGLGLCFALLGADTVVGYGLGIVLSAFFLRIGGGLYQSGIQSGVDAIESTQKELPPFDSRNPATLLGIAGSYVRDLTGYVSDILSSYMLAIVACVAVALPSGDPSLLVLPLWLVSLSIMATLISYGFWRIRMRGVRLNNILLEGIYLSAFICVAGTAVILSLVSLPYPSTTVFICYVSGLVGAVVMAFSSEVLSSYRYRFTQGIIQKAEYGTVITHIGGLSLGLIGTSLYCLYIIAILAISYHFAATSPET